MALLLNKVALIAGGSRGIGESIARLFAEEGAAVFLTGRKLDDARAAAHAIGHGATGLKLEMTERASWQEAISEVEGRFGKLDILVNSAGVCVSSTIDDTTDDNWRQHMAVNVDGVFLGCQMALPLLRVSGAGSVINIASINGLRPIPSHLAYSASKAAVTAMSKSMALHCATEGHGVRVNLIHPGGIQTEMFDQAIQEMNMPTAEALALVVESHPMGRIGRPDEVAQAALWLASDASSFTTGADITVDGGSAIRS